MSANGHTGASAAATRHYAPYVQADWGYANHWYPALFSGELPDGGFKGVTIGGHDVGLRRSARKVYGLSDRCIHRGVKLSAKPTPSSYAAAGTSPGGGGPSGSFPSRQRVVS